MIVLYAYFTYTQSSNKCLTDLFKQDFQTLRSPFSIHFPCASHCHRLASLMIVSLTCLGARKVMNRKGLKQMGKQWQSHYFVRLREQTRFSSKENQRKHVVSALSEPSKWNQSWLWNKLSGSVSSKRFSVVNSSFEVLGAFEMQVWFF